MAFCLSPIPILQYCCKLHTSTRAADKVVSEAEVFSPLQHSQNPHHALPLPHSELELSWIGTNVLPSSRYEKPTVGPKAARKKPCFSWEGYQTSSKIRGNHFFWSRIVQQERCGAALDTALWCLEQARRERIAGNQFPAN
jgi:hypothetical protein